jgi:hypothetical protein
VIVFCFQVILISSRLRRVSSKEATPVPLLGTWLPNCSSVVDLAGLSFIVFDSNVTVNRVRGNFVLDWKFCSWHLALLRSFGGMCSDQSCYYSFLLFFTVIPLLSIHILW